MSGKFSKDATDRRAQQAGVEPGPHGPASERIMRHYYGAARGVPDEGKASTQPAPVATDEQLEAMVEAYESYQSPADQGLAQQMEGMRRALAALPAPVATDAERGDRVCEEADGCPTETAVLKRFWREHQNHPGEHPNHPGFHNLIRKGGAF